MRFIFKTDYGQDIRLAKHGGQVFWYGALLLLLLAAPWLFAEYWLAPADREAALKLLASS